MKKRELEKLLAAKVVNIPHLARKHGLEITTIVDAIAGNPTLWKGRQMVDDAWTNQSAEPWAYEVTKKLERGFVRGRYLYQDEMEDQVHEPSYHHSTFLHDKRWIDNLEKTGSLSLQSTWVQPSGIYIELDRPTYEEAEGDAAYILSNFDMYMQNTSAVRGGDYIRVWFSGNKSIHIGINPYLFGRPILNQRAMCGVGKVAYNLAMIFSDGCRYGFPFDSHLATIANCRKTWNEAYGTRPPDDPQLLRQGLEHLDPNLYRLNSTIRYPGSIHEKGGRPKERITAWSVAKLLVKSKVEVPYLTAKGDGVLWKPCPPYLMDLYFQARKIRKPETKVPKVKQYDGPKSFVLEFYAKHLPGFDTDKVNGSGWVPDMYSPFYDDHRPSVSVCVNPKSPQFGQYKDFGNPEHTFDFLTFVSKVLNITTKEAKRYVEENE